MFQKIFYILLGILVWHGRKLMAQQRINVRMVFSHRYRLTETFAHLGRLDKQADNENGVWRLPSRLIQHSIYAW